MQRLASVSRERAAIDAEVQQNAGAIANMKPVPKGDDFRKYASELRVSLAAVRVVWLQQWVVGAFDYLDHSILAAVVRGVSDPSISRAWVPPNRFRPPGKVGDLVFEHSQNVWLSKLVELNANFDRTNNPPHRTTQRGPPGRLF